MKGKNRSNLEVKFNTLVISAALALAAWSSTASKSEAATVHEVNQLIDLNALTPEEVYRFVPNYLWIEPGDTLRFLNSLGDHTVTSVRGMWPEGVDTVNIEHKKVASVTLETPGLYAFRCKVHGRHGMFALVVVGTPEPNLDKIEYINIGQRARGVLEELFVQLNEDIARRTE